MKEGGYARRSTEKKSTRPPPQSSQSRLDDSPPSIARPEPPVLLLDLRRGDGTLWQGHRGAEKLEHGRDVPSAMAVRAGPGAVEPCEVASVRDGSEDKVRGRLDGLVREAFWRELAHTCSDDVLTAGYDGVVDG